VVSEQWSAVGGQWSVVTGQLPAAPWEQRATDN